MSGGRVTDERLAERIATLERTCAEFAKDEADLVREINELRQDAERYRFLRADRRILNAMPRVREAVHKQLREEWRATYPHGGPGAFSPVEDRHIDAAIDAELAESQT